MEPTEVFKVYIYALSDPETGEIRYVGKTNKPDRRYNQHLEMRCGVKINS